MGKRSQANGTQGTNPAKEGQCILNTAQCLEKEKGNQTNSSSKLLENRKRQQVIDRSSPKTRTMQVEWQTKGEAELTGSLHCF